MTSKVEYECEECGNLIFGVGVISKKRLLCPDCYDDERENAKIARSEARRGMRHG